MCKDLPVGAGFWQTMSPASNLRDLGHCERKDHVTNDLGDWKLRWRQARVLSGDQPEYGPILVGVAPCDRGQETVANHARDRHRDALGFRCLKHQTRVLESERQREDDRVVTPFPR